VHFVGLFLSSLLKMHGPKNKLHTKRNTHFMYFLFFWFLSRKEQNYLHVWTRAYSEVSDITYTFAHPLKASEDISGYIGGTSTFGQIAFYIWQCCTGEIYWNDKQHSCRCGFLTGNSTYFRQLEDYTPLSNIVLTILLWFFKTDHSQVTISSLCQIRNKHRNILSINRILDAQLGKGIQEQGNSKQNNRQMPIKTLKSSGKYVHHS